MVTPKKINAQTRRFVERLTRPERLLVVVARELYGGDWDQVVADLRARLTGRPFVFKLAHRIEDDLDRIERLRRFEEAHRVDLSEWVTLESVSSSEASS